MGLSDKTLIRPENWFRETLPSLDERDCIITSRRTFDYNCVGFVAGDFRWWYPDDLPDHYWPENVPQDPRCWAHMYVEALETVHFKGVDYLPEFEPENYENIVLYHHGGQFRHAAIQIAPDRWKSKLGEYEDLEHPANAIDGGKYGSVFRYMRRPIHFGGFSLPPQYDVKHTR